MAGALTVRMYEVGFGDCFLITLGEGAQAKRVLVDCGSITEGKAQVAKVAQDVIETCRDANGVARIDLVVATHRHKDHVGGFSNPAWAEVKVGEVWMPWTEDPEDERATYIRNRQSALALRLAGGDTDEEPLAMAPSGETTAAAGLRAIRGQAVNALTNEKAMAMLHSGFARGVRPVFLPVKDVTCEARTVAGIPGMRVHVLGPPRNEKAIAVMDPPDGAGYLTASGAGGGPADAFAAYWRTDLAAYRADAPKSTFSDDDLALVDRNAEEPTGALAAALDNAVNNTSLILMFEIGDHWLLFPGDAQWGGWNAALEDPASKAVLQKTTFYKVGHHASHNATPKALIETLMAPGFTAMVSTCHVTQWPDIPRAPLVTAIDTKAKRWARSDDENKATASGFTVKPGLYVEWVSP